ncbi:LAME_0C08570g1_1 [Lachancea meyersii CBS 8951]|uniref:LAME_0C08570g1_1 n=1 Tax=Lachancea meyersii CBS 8951 TaxID=1266667 RepID=A0A1G4J369_9SACH|nr:LAME_0C08570g1_1 [Lachancea meyersii CBS 8951]
MNNKHATNTSKKLKQFSTKSRSKSAANFKGLNQLRRVLSHDGSYSLEDHIKERSGSMKKSKSSDSLHRKRAISGLNMTALGRVSSNSTSSHHESSGSLALAAGLKPLRGSSTKSVLDLRDGDEMYQDHSTTDEEVEYFTDEEDRKESTQQSAENRGEHLLRGNKSELQLDSQPGIQHAASRPHSAYESHSHEAQSFDDEDSQSDRSGEDHTLLDSDGASTEQNAQEGSPGLESRADSSNTLRNQPCYGVPSNMRRPSEDRISSTDHIQTLDQISNDTRQMGGNNFANQDQGPEDDQIDSSDRIDQNGAEEDIIYAPNNIEIMANSLKRHGPTSNRANDLAYADNEQDIPPEDYLRGREKKAEGRYSPTMILSQSTGVEKRFDGSPSLSDETGSQLLKSENNPDSTKDGIQSGNNNNSNNNNTKSNNNFRYINNDFASSFNSNQGTQRFSSSSVKPDFSTSISSLSSHLSRPINSMNDNKSYKVSNQKVGQPLATTHNNSRPHLEAKKSNSNRSEGSSNLNNFSNFLQAESNGTESRTQQKLWLQRENSLMDLSSQNSSLDSIFLASNIEVKREFERISREYTNVRRFSNPVTASLNRVAPRSRLDTKKHRMALSQSDELTKVFRNDGSQNGKTLQDFCKENMKLNIDVQRVLSSIWNKESAAFNHRSEVLAQNDIDNSSLGYGTPARSQTRHSLRSSYGSSNNINYQRGLGTLQPTTRAVHRRMESALNQQQRP